MNETLEYIFEKFKPVKGRRLPWTIEAITRESIPETLGELGFSVGVEVGVAQGNHAKTLCDHIPDLKLYCVDVWDRYPGYYEYTDRIRKYYREAQERLAPYNVTFVKKFSMDAVKDFENRSLDFAYIDSSHYLVDAINDIWWWAQKVKYGGVVFGHDYKWRRGKRGKKYVVHVRGAVQAYCYAQAIDPWFHLKVPRQDSWMFVRQEGDWV